MSEKRKKYLVPIILSAVASVLLIAFCISAIFTHLNRDLDARVLKHNTEDWWNDRPIHMGIEIPVYKVNRDEEIELKIYIGISDDYLNKAEEITLVLPGWNSDECSLKDYQGDFMCKINEGDYGKGSLVYENTNTTEYSCSECYNYPDDQTEMNDDEIKPYTCKFNHSDTLTFKYIGKEERAKGALSFITKGYSEELRGSEVIEKEWYGAIVIYYEVDGEYMAFGISKSDANKKLPIR